MSKKVNEKAKYAFTGCMFLGMGIGYYLGYFIVGIALSSTGLYLFSEAVAQGSFSSGLVASLFLYYGVLSLKLLFLSK